MRAATVLWSLLSSRWLLAAPAPAAPLPPHGPTITLPWGTWAPTHYDQEGKFYTFKNIRYGKAPTGPLRFAAPVYPDNLTSPNDLQDNTYGPACHQIRAETCDCPPSKCPSNSTSTSFMHTQAIPQTSEDCLFLDLYVPESAFSANASLLPVVVWLHGGGYVLGAKDTQDAGIPLYNGTGVLRAARAAGQELVFAVPNYRLGAFGWLAGPSVEAGGVANAGLHDQRLALQWVQDFAQLFGGDSDQVSAWGESAGAGSIVCHLVAEGGTRDPLFRRAVVMSPASQWVYNRRAGGEMEQAYRQFAELAGCGDGEMDCLREQDEGLLAEASQAAFEGAKCDGRPAFGPAVDGSVIRQLPAAAFHEGNYWPHLDSLVASHVADETGSFVPAFVANDTDLQRFVHTLFPQPDLDLVRTLVFDRYAGGDARNRTAALLRDAYFTCPVRQLVDGYSPAFLMQYDFLAWLGLAVHAADLLALFWNPDFDIGAAVQDAYPDTPAVMVELVAGTFGDFAQQYQVYLASAAATGRPGELAGELPEWSEAVGREDGGMDNVMETGYSFFGNFFGNDSVDSLLGNEVCDFWAEIAGIVDQKYGPEADEGGLTVQN